MLNTFIEAVATGERTNIIPYIAIGVAALVLVVLLCLPAFKKKPTDPSDKQNTEDPNE